METDMQVATFKVCAAIKALHDAADELVFQRGNPGVVAAECIKAMAALEASLSVAGEPRVMRVVGETD
jgi:hypothetical protein